MFHIKQLSPERPIMATLQISFQHNQLHASTTFGPQVTHDTPLALPEKDMLRQNT